MTNPARREADEDLPGPRLGELDVLDGERTTELLEDRRPDLHAVTLTYTLLPWVF